MSFDGSPQVCTRTYGATDQLLPPLGTIQLLPSSLPSQEQDLVTGDVNRDITGNVLYLLTGNRNNTTTLNLSDTVNGNHDYLLQQKLTHTVQGPTNETKHGPHLHSNSSSRIDNFTGTVSRFFQAETKELHPEQWLQKFKDWAHYSNYYVKINGLDVAISYVSKVSIASYTITARKAGLKIGGSELTLHDTHLKIAATTNHIKAHASKIVCTAILIGVLSVGTPFKPNALPRPTPITPFD